MLGRPVILLPKTEEIARGEEEEEEEEACETRSKYMITSPNPKP